MRSVKLTTLVYEQYLASSGRRHRFWSFLRQLLIQRLNDPPCSILIHGRQLQLPLSHLLPIYLQQFPEYDQLPHRISEFIHQTKGCLNCIDVGANIGDTIAAFYQQDTDIFLAIEPNPKFNQLLAKNWNWHKNITIISDICSSSSSSQETFLIQEKDGTASIFQAENGIKLNQRSLDEIIKDMPLFHDANVLKIDTDGHDFEVIAGARSLLERNLPAVLFECDVFDNANYIDDCLRTLNIFQQSGYNAFLLYDNFGHLMGKYSLADLAPFRNLLFFQLTTNFYYFDILVMVNEDLSQFYQSEIDYFARKIPQKSLQTMAIAVAQSNG